MKRLLDLRPCDNCGGSIAPNFYVLRVSLALIKPKAVNEFFGMHQFFGGKASPALVENFAPAAADAVVVAGDKEPSLMTEFVICTSCYFDGQLDLPRLAEKRRAADAKNDDREAAAGRVAKEAAGQ